MLEKGITLVSNEYGDHTQFLFDGVNEVKPDMIKEATANARLAAEKFTQDSKAKVGTISRATQGVLEIEDRDVATPEIKILRVVTTIDFFSSKQPRPAPASRPPSATPLIRQLQSTTIV